MVNLKLVVPLTLLAWCQAVDKGSYGSYDGPNPCEDGTNICDGNNGLCVHPGDSTAPSFVEDEFGMSYHCECNTGYVLADSKNIDDNTCYEDCGKGTFEAGYVDNRKNCVAITECNKSSEYEVAPPTSTSDRVCMALTTCSSTEYESTEPSPSSNRNCQALTLCKFSEYESFAPQPSSDRTCNALTTCKTQQFVATPPTTTSDRVCQTYKKCSKLEYDAGFEFGGDRLCLPLSTCDFSSHYQKVAATLKSDRVCAALLECTAGFYETGAPTTTSNRKCSPTYKCNYITQWTSAEATGTSDAVCTDLTPCEVGVTYESVPPTTSSDRKCKPLTTCTLGSTYETGITATGDRECSAVTTCDSSEYIRKEATLTENNICTKSTVCNPGQVPQGEGATKKCKQPLAEFNDRRLAAFEATKILNAATTFFGRRLAEVQCTTDNQCTSGKCLGSKCQFYENCPSGQYAESGSLTDEGNGPVCRGVTICDSSSEYLKTASTLTSDNVCEVLKACDLVGALGTKQYESKSPTVSSNRECADVRPCTTNQFEKNAATATSDTQCLPYLTCDSSQYVSVSPTSSSNLVCATIATCDSSTQYEAKAPGSEVMFGTTTMTTSNRACATRTTCPETQYNSQTDLAQDASCQPLTLCTQTQYESTVATKTSDRVCTDVTNCNFDVEFESEPAKVTSDRTCQTAEVCYSGTGVQTRYFTALHTQSADSVCADLSVCSSNAQYETGAPSKMVDRTCSVLQTCSEFQYESLLATTTSDRACTPLKQCLPMQFESVKKTSTSDRSCSPVTPCNETAHEVNAPTATSDRECALITESPTPAPTPDPTPDPTPAPTPYPTPDPTPAPTPAPTFENKTVHVTISLPFPCADVAASADLRAALIAGVQKTAGGKPTRITNCNGAPLAEKSARRLNVLISTDIEFEIVVEGETARLATASTMREKAQDGTLMANIKQAAKASNVSTPALEDADNKFCVLVDDEKSKCDTTDSRLIVAVVVAGVVMLIGIALVVKHKNSSSKYSLEQRVCEVHDLHSPTGAAPVHRGSVQDALSAGGNVPDAQYDV